MSTLFWIGIAVLAIIGFIGWFIEYLFSTGEIEPMHTPWEK